MRNIICLHAYTKTFKTLFFKGYLEDFQPTQSLHEPTQAYIIFDQFSRFHHQIS